VRQKADLITQVIDGNYLVINNFHKGEEIINEKKVSARLIYAINPDFSDL